MSAHTPGPWAIGPKLHGFDHSIINPAGDAELGDWLVAGVRWEANAHLIVAAPDLLDAADRAEWWLSTVPGSDAIRLVLRTAIEKARGRSEADILCDLLKQAEGKP